ncbi:TPA: Holliday junction resolvase RuvX [Candidatus Uhrbacteria bacterium]|nr:Holliday junction resolvase RuvX [Candidatus Uhrbacteria bacterium]
MRFLGIDFGLKKIGLAIGDDSSGLAFPLEVIPGGIESIPYILKLVKAEGLDALVVGVPYQSNPEHSSTQVDLTLKFIEALTAATKLPIIQADEKFSSSEARRMQQEFGVKAQEDAIAAQLVLQAHLDDLRRLA